MTKLKKMYNGAKLRCYREDEDGKEHFYYEDPLNRVIIREAFTSDAKNIIMAVPGLIEEKLIKEIEKNDSEDPNMIIVLETKSKFLGCMDVYSGEIAEAGVRIWMKNPQMKATYFEKIVQSLQNMCNIHGVWEKLDLIAPEQRNLFPQ